MTNLIGISGRIGSGKDTFAKMIQLVIYNNVYGSKHPITEPTELALKHIGQVITNEWQVKKFATPLKQMACILIGCTMEQLEDQDFKASELPEQWDRLYYPDYLGGGLYRGNPDDTHSIKSYVRKATTVREVLQKLGTEAIRGIIHDNAWVNAMFSIYSSGRFFMCDNCMTDNIQEILEEDTCPRCNFKSEGNLTMVIEDTCSKWLIADLRFPNEVKAIKDRGGLVFRVKRTFVDTPSNHTSETALDSYTGWDETIMNLYGLEELYDIAKYIVDKYHLS